MFLDQVEQYAYFEMLSERQECEFVEQDEDMYDSTESCAL